MTIKLRHMCVPWLSTRGYYKYLGATGLGFKVTTFEYQHSKQSINRNGSSFFQNGQIISKLPCLGTRMSFTDTSNWMGSGENCIVDRRTSRYLLSSTNTPNIDIDRNGTRFSLFQHGPIQSELTCRGRHISYTDTSNPWDQRENGIATQTVTGK